MAPVAIAGQAAPQADEGRRCGDKLPRHAFDDCVRQTADRRHPARGATGQHFFGELLEAAGQGMGRIAGNAHGAAIFDLDQQAAGIRTVVRADGANNIGAHGNFPPDMQAKTFYPVLISFAEQIIRGTFEVFKR
jgi:hypothetical protein